MLVHTLSKSCSEIQLYGYDNTRKIHWVDRKKVTQHKKLGGLGAGDLRSMNIAPLAKW